MPVAPPPAPPAVQRTIFVQSLIKERLAWPVSLKAGSGRVIAEATSYPDFFAKPKKEAMDES